MNRVFIAGVVIAGSIALLLLRPWATRHETAAVNHRAPAPAPANDGAALSASQAIKTVSVLSAPSRDGQRTELPAARGTNLLHRLLAGEEPPRLHLDQAEAFVSANARSAAALLAAWQTSGSKSFLQEAMENFPGDPAVAYLAWAQRGGSENAPEAEQARREWLDKFRAAAPDEALPDYLVAREHFKAGDSANALQSIADAQTKPWRDYTLTAIQNVEEAYRAAGWSEAEAKAASMMGALLPQLSPIRDVGRELAALAKGYRESGDNESAHAAVQWAQQIATRLENEGNPTLLQRLVGIAIERQALGALDAGSALGDSGTSVEQYLAAADQRRAVVREIARNSGEIMPQLSEPELAMYFDRLKLFGEEAAVQWATGRMAR